MDDMRALSHEIDITNHPSELNMKADCENGGRVTVTLKEHPQRSRLRYTGAVAKNQQEIRYETER
ncbi:hypothetical protein [Pseudomonas prosekii]|uniref:hypothetical protein n=1 Tax=Pseudomonas prosekii TaxID=1148509 RepID=UPI001605081F|nr:hypothetical protein [Pseudomonas prosekii]